MHTRLKEVLQNPITRIALMIVLADLGELTSDFDPRLRSFGEFGGQPIYLRYSKLYIFDQYQVSFRTDCRLRHLLLIQALN